MGFFRRLKAWFSSRRRRRSRGPLSPPVVAPRPPRVPLEEFERQRYASTNYLLFGRAPGDYPPSLDVDGALGLLGLFGSEAYSSGLAWAGQGTVPALQPLPAGTHVCDFCGRVIPSGEGRLLSDGRERCEACSKSAVRGAGAVRELFRGVKANMEDWYGARFENAIGVSVVSAAKLHRLKGQRFVPTSSFDARTIGFVLAKRGRQVMVLENGSPRLRLVATMAHELTHCWQNQVPYFTGLHDRVAAGEMDARERLALLEGQATWAEVQYLFLLGEDDDARSLRDSYLRRQDEYGEGFRLYLARYPFATDGARPRETPFDHPEGPVREPSPW